MNPYSSRKAPSIEPPYFDRLASSRIASQCIGCGMYWPRKIRPQYT